MVRLPLDPMLVEYVQVTVSPSTTLDFNTLPKLLPYSLVNSKENTYVPV